MLTVKVTSCFSQLQFSMQLWQVPSIREKIKLWFLIKAFLNKEMHPDVTKAAMTQTKRQVRRAHRFTPNSNHAQVVLVKSWRAAGASCGSSLTKHTHPFWLNMMHGTHNSNNSTSSSYECFQPQLSKCPLPPDKLSPKRMQAEVNQLP